MLPFLGNQKKNQQAGVIVQERQANQNEPQLEETELVDIIIDALNAYKSRDIKTLALLTKELHDCLHKFMDKDEAEPSFASQNELAGRE